MSRTLLVSSHTPALGSGRGLRTYGLVRALAAHGPVDLLYTRFGPAEPAAAYREIPGLALHEVRPSRGLRRALAFARARAGGVPSPLARGVSAEMARAGGRLEATADRVVADDPMTAVALSGLARRRPVIYSAHNLESAFRTDWGPRERLQAFERGILERSSESWMPSERDLEGARALAPGAVLRLVPNVVDVAAIAPAVARPATPTAMFVADFSYAPNRQGLDFLLHEVLPRAWALVPDLRLRVVGRGIDAPEAVDPRVEFAGFVDDLDAAYASASCAVVPLLTGGGSPLKFVEALAHALPVVATPRAAAGLRVRAGEHYLEGDGPAAFAEALAAAVSHERGAAIAASGRSLAEREYSIEALVTRVAP